MNYELLIIFENEKIFSGALTYAREYAIRTEARVSFLMLVTMSFSIHDSMGARRNAIQKIEAKAGKLLAELTEKFIQKGLNTSSALRIGDPAQELLKFIEKHIGIQKKGQKGGRRSRRRRRRKTKRKRRRTRRRRRGRRRIKRRR